MGEGSEIAREVGSKPRTARLSEFCDQELLVVSQQVGVRFTHSYDPACVADAWHSLRTTVESRFPSPDRTRQLAMFSPCLKPKTPD
jgi:hypothetical protein